MENNWTIYLIAGLIAGLISFILAPLGARIMRRLGAVTVPKPTAQGGRYPGRRIPYVGGWVTIATFFLVLGYFALFREADLFGGILREKYVWGLFIAAIVYLIGGFLDDKYKLPPRWQALPGLLAIGVVVASGIGIESIRNPLGGIIPLNQWSFTLFSHGDLPYRIVLWADLFTLIWLSGMDYSMQWIDGIDGLSAGIAAIGFLVIFGLSLSAQVMQPEIAFLSIIMAGALIGFLPYFWPSAKMLAGQAGGQFWGFLLGVLAILSGAKIATALLVMWIPIMDVARLIAMRVWQKRSPFKGDANHIHHWLLRAGLSERQTVILLYAISAAAGGLALGLEGVEKLIALTTLAGGALIFFYFLWRRVRNRSLE